jgi:Ribose/xylose/arabinose/galactoside ABC-type transport systems, permease components
VSNTQETRSTSHPAPTADVKSTRAKIADFISDNGALVGLLVLCVAMFIATPDFLTPNNLLNVGIQASVVAILAFGQTFVIVTAGIDLSVGSVAALSAMVAAFTGQSWGMPPLVALLFGLLTGLAAGMLSGAATAYAKLPPFIATLAMLSVARGLTLVVSNGIPIPTSSVVTWLGGSVGPIPMPVVVLLVMGAIGWFILNRLSIGRAMYAVGGNLEAARLSGIPVKRVLVTVYALSGIFAAVAGLVLSGRLASAQPQAATGYELDAIAAVVIGGASLAGGVGKISGTLIGALVLAVIRNGLNLLNVSAFWQQVIIGLVIAVAVGIDVLRRKRA